MKQKEKKRKCKYPRLRRGDDLLSILPEEPASDSRCPTLQVGGPETTTTAETTATPAPSANSTISATTTTPSQSTATNTQATYRTVSGGPAAPAHNGTPAKTHERRPAESAATSAPRPDRAPAPGPDPIPVSPERHAEGKKAPKKGWRRKKKKTGSSKTVHIASLPDKYEPLEEGVVERESKEEKKYKRKQMAKKYAKNVGKALQTGCRYLLIGFQGLANSYATSWGMTAAAVVGMAR